MSESAIEWTDATWNPVAGCSVQSAGCTNCYAMHMARRLEAMGVAKYDGIASANLGGGVVKDRIPREGQGRSGGFRTLCCLRDDGIAIFFSLFAKKDKANIDNQELQEARRIAAGFRALSEDELRAATAAGTLRMINEGDDDAVTETDEMTRSNEPDNQHQKSESLT